jgi:hypothetical protein
MTVVPLPDVPCVRVRLIYQDTDGNEMGSRFYLSYTGSAPSGANCTTLAGDIETAWAAHLISLVGSNIALTEIDVLDIATDSGLSGQWTGSTSGTGGGATAPIQCANDVEFNISRRYRGGKPRMYLPPGATSSMLNAHQWTTGFTSSTTTDVTAFFAAIEALTVGTMGTLQHVNLSYYKGFTNITNSSGRERAVPKYRDTALHDVVTGYSGKQLIGSQRRRRTSTTP